MAKNQGRKDNCAKIELMLRRLTGKYWSASLIDCKSFCLINDNVEINDKISL